MTVLLAPLPVGLSLFIVHRGAVAVPSDATYVPGSKCKTCHIKEYKKQAEAIHFQTFENLKDVGEDSNAECMPCHTTGHGKTGGFTDVASTPELAGTTCQACHGPGSAHIEKGLSKEQRREAIQRVPQDACTKCHKTHEDHPEISNKAGLKMALQKKLERLQSRIGAL